MYKNILSIVALMSLLALPSPAQTETPLAEPPVVEAEKRIGDNAIIEIEQSHKEQLEALISEMTLVLLNSNSPVELGSEHGYRGVVLSTPGTSLSPSTNSFTASGGAYVLQHHLQNILIYDSVLAVRDGRAQATLEPIHRVWNDLLKWTQPVDANWYEKLDEKTKSVLFKTADRVDLARGVRFMREPSEYLTKYKVYEELAHILERVQDSGDSGWKLHPRLEKYGTLSDAKIGIRQEWVEFGYQTEVRDAIENLDAAGGAQWTEWCGARDRFDSYAVPIVTFDVIPQTYLFPPIEDWATINNWIRFATIEKSSGIEMRCQLCIVHINRPWMDIDAVLDKRLKIQEKYEDQAITLSNDLKPTLLKYPKGRLAVYPEEIILVRDIRFSSEPHTFEHPLMIFAYPESINLLGYIVRAIPVIGAS